MGAAVCNLKPEACTLKDSLHFAKHTRPSEQKDTEGIEKFLAKTLL